MNETTNRSMEEFVQQQTEVLSELWRNSSEEINHLPPSIPYSRKIENEKNLSNLLEWMASGLDKPAMKEDERRKFSEETIRRLKTTGKSIFDLDDEEVNCLEALGIDRCARNFYLKAREFDPFICFDDIFQASRNVWTCNYLQCLLGLPVQLTPAVFAYSMLYPVSDNYLDDERYSLEEKIAYNQRFRSRLKGERVPPQCWNEEDIDDLVEMIERQYPRSQCSPVYESLLAIHSAQQTSLYTQHALAQSSTLMVEGITFEKGGTSVLADGVLAAGKLSTEEMEAIFNYGAFAQLMDDQEDLHGDLKSGSLTLFTQAAHQGKVDRVMNKVFSFAHEVLQGLHMFNPTQAQPLKRISMKGIDLLLIDGVLRTESYYSNGYLSELEKHFPFRFEYLKRVRKEIRKKKITLGRVTGLLAGPLESERVDPLSKGQRLVNPVRINPLQVSCESVQDHP